MELWIKDKCYIVPVPRWTEHPISILVCVILLIWPFGKLELDEDTPGYARLFVWVTWWFVRVLLWAGIFYITLKTLSHGRIN